MVCLFFKNTGTEKQYIIIAHVMDGSNIFLFYENFQTKFTDLKCNYIEYQGIVSSIKIQNVFWNLEKHMLLIISLQHIPTLSNTVQNFQPNVHRHGKPPSESKRYTNSRLFKIKLVDSLICSFCHNAEETLVQLFCECPVSKSSWNAICSWYSCISKTTLLRVLL